MSKIQPTPSLSSTIPVSRLASFDVPSFEANLASLLAVPSMLDPSVLAKSKDALTIWEIQSVRKLSDAFSMLCSRGGLLDHDGSQFDYVTKLSKQALTISPDSLSQQNDDTSSVARSRALSAIADEFSKNEAWHAQVDETFRGPRDQLEADLKAITAMCDFEFGQEKRLEHMRQVLKRENQAGEPISEAEDLKSRRTDWGLFHAFVVSHVQHDLQHAFHNESFEPTHPELQIDNYKEKFAQGKQSALLQTVASHVEGLKDKLRSEVWFRKEFTLDVITKWMHAVGIGGKLPLFEATRDTTTPLNPDCDDFHEDALDIFVDPGSDDPEVQREAMKASVRYRAKRAAQALVGEDWLKESRSALGLAKAQDRSSRRPKL